MLAAIAVNHLHHAWSSFAGLDDWLSRLARDLSQEEAITDAADRIRIHCAAMLAQQFVSIYRGRFLGNEPANRWLQSARERWHARYIRVVIDAGERIEAEQGVDIALPLYQRAVEHDALCEELHRRLIAACLRQGEHAEAINVFRRLRHSLSLSLGVMPSEKTLALVAPLGAATEKHVTAISPRPPVRPS